MQAGTSIELLPRAGDAAMSALVLNLKPFIVTDDEFVELTKANPELRFERLATGEVTIMPPTGSDAGVSSGGVFAQLWSWNNQNRSGYCFDSSTGFRLPDGAIRSPDAAWVPKERYEALAPALRRGFAPICPDFVVEVVSPSDDLETVQAKLREYILNGARLGWLIDPETRRVEIYQPGESVTVFDDPATMAGEPVLPGFILDLSRVFVS
jgi:Uma2 family endonuclease